ncbi:MAG: TIM-barrel domain-containing protein [Nonlabens sp.]
MRFSKYLLLVLVVASFRLGSAQVVKEENKSSLRQFTEVEAEENQLNIHVNDGMYAFKILGVNVIETQFYPYSDKKVKSKKSHAVVKKPLAIKPHLRTIDQGFVLGIKKALQVKISKKPFQISYLYNGKPLISEAAGYEDRDSLKTIQLQIDKQEVLYGGGARAMGMNRRGNRLQLYNRAHYGYETRAELMNYTLPLVISSRNYAVHFDNAPIGFLDLDSRGDNTITYETISGSMRYQVIAGNNLKEVTQNYVELTGKQPMPPRWALGNFASRFGYHSQEEVETTVNKFKEEDIPVDAIVLDLYWFGKEIKGTMGNLKFYRDSFPEPRKMIKDLHDKNVETILITEPFILSTSDRWEEAVKKDILAKDSIGDPYQYEFYFGNTGLIDIYSDKGNNWFKNIYKDLSEMGVNGFWGDLGEPEVHPSDLIHATGTADEVHNIYGHDWAKLVYEASLEAAPNRRPFILMRAGYSGSQHYGLIPWSGDVNRTWGGLQSQPEIALQMGMQGLGYMHSDLGGFAGANLDDELYVRWLQYGVFQPIYRPHAQEEVPSEPIYRSKKAMELAKQAIELRYKLLPYNYQLAYENHTEGTPLMRPVFFENGERLETASSYLWGNNFFVVPVLEAGLKTMDIELPSGYHWFDFYTDQVYKVQKISDFTLSENNIPTFVRAGSFIPMSKGLQSTKKFDNTDFELHYYHHKSEKVSRQSFYNDDGTTHEAFEKGMYELLDYSAFLKRKTLKIYLEATIGKNYATSDKTVDLIIHNIKKQPKKVKGIKGENWEWNETSKTLKIELNWNTAKDRAIKIKL